MITIIAQSMDLTQPLHELLHRTPGALGAILIDNEGEAITFATQPHFDLNDEEAILRMRLIGAYHRVWLNDALIVVERMKQGELNCLVQKFADGVVIGKALRDHHALVLVGAHDMLIGKGLFLLQQIGAELERDL